MVGASSSSAGAATGRAPACPVVFLLSDSQLVAEGMLEDVNNILNTGEAPAMLGREEKDRKINACLEAARDAGVGGSRDAVYSFLIAGALAGLGAPITESLAWLTDPPAPEERDWLVFGPNPPPSSDCLRFLLGEAARNTQTCSPSEGCFMRTPHTEWIVLHSADDTQVATPDASCRVP